MIMSRVVGKIDTLVVGNAGRHVDLLHYDLAVVIDCGFAELA